jgi:hypothetical protein
MDEQELTGEAAIAYYFRRAAEEQAKAAEARGVVAQLEHLELAELFRRRAEAAQWKREDQAGQ